MDIRWSQLSRRRCWTGCHFNKTEIGRHSTECLLCALTDRVLHGLARIGNLLLAHNRMGYTNKEGFFLQAVLMTVIAFFAR